MLPTLYPRLLPKGNCRVGSSVLPIQFCSIDILSLEVQFTVWKLTSYTKQGRTGSDKQITHLLLSDLQYLGKIGWMKQPLVPADLPSLGPITGVTLRMDELFWNNLSNAADTNRLSSNTREARPRCLFLLNTIPANSPATFLEGSFCPGVVQGSVKSWENVSGWGASRTNFQARLSQGHCCRNVGTNGTPKCWGSERLLCLWERLLS